MSEQQAADFAAMAAGFAALAAGTPPRPTLSVLDQPPSALLCQDVLTPADAAAYMQLNESVILQEAAAGRLPGRCLGGQWRFSRTAILTWLGTSETPMRTSKERALAVAGIWKDDPTVDAMVEEIYRERKRHPVGGK